MNKLINWKDSKKILKLLASISTKKHAEQIIKRNTEVLNNKGSIVHCPHCSYSEGHYNCSNCLWTCAVEKITCSLPPSGRFYVLPSCLRVRFASSKEINALKIYDTIQIEVDSLIFLPNLTEQDESNIKRWLQAHIDWAKDIEKWGTQPAPEGFRGEVNV